MIEQRNLMKDERMMENFAFEMTLERRLDEKSMMKQQREINYIA
jgi:hypothetical protein